MKIDLQMPAIMCSNCMLYVEYEVQSNTFLTNLVNVLSLFNNKSVHTLIDLMKVMDVPEETDFLNIKNDFY